jgi:hypothetical protein
MWMGPILKIGGMGMVGLAWRKIIMGHPPLKTLTSLVKLFIYSISDVVRCIRILGI